MLGKLGFNKSGEYRNNLFPQPVYINSSPTAGIESITDFNGDKGTIVLDYTDLTANNGNDSIIAMLSDGTNNNRIFIQKRATGDRFRVLTQGSAGTNEIWDGYLSSWANGNQKIAIGYDVPNGEFRIWINGMLLCQINNNWAMNTLSQVDLGQLLGGAFAFNGTFNKLEYYDKLLSDKQGTSITNDVAILDGITLDTTKDGYAFLGQSNSVGQASGVPVYTNTGSMFLLNNAMSLGSYSDPYADPTSSKVTGLNDAGGNYDIGYAGYFADNLSGFTGNDICVCPVNLSGTSFEGTTPTWDISSSTYRTSGTKIVGMMATATSSIHQLQLMKQHVNIKSIIWGQGEADVTNGTAQASYETHLTDLINMVRGAVGNTIPWFNVSMPSYSGWTTQSNWNAIDIAQQNVASSINRVFFVDGTDIAGNPSDQVHYDLAGYEAVGKTMAGAVFDALIPLNTFSSTDGTERTIDLSNVNWVSGAGGFIWGQLEFNNEATGNEYPLVIDDGGTGNVAGIRIYSANAYAGYWFRGGGSNLASTHMGNSGVPEIVFGYRQSVGISWNNITGEAYEYTQGHVAPLDLSAQMIRSLSRLNVNGRNGNNQLDGAIHKFEVGNKYITPVEMEARISSLTSRKVTAGAGQSLEIGALNSQQSSSQVGYDALLSNYSNVSSGIEFMYFGDAQGGSSLFKINTSTSEYWWDEDTDTAGSMLQRLYDDLGANGVVPQYLSWEQGEQDALFLNTLGRPTGTDYKNKLQLMFGDIRSKYGDVQIFIKIIGARLDGVNTNDGGTQAVRTAQLDLINELSYVHLGAEQYHIGLTDNLHPDDAGYVTIFGNQGKSMASFEGVSISNPLGAKIVNASRFGNVITLTTDRDLATSTIAEGFKFFDSTGAEIAISNVSANGSKISVTLGMSPSDSNGTLYYPYDKLEGVNRANLVVDIDGMPLRSVVIRSL